MGTIIHLPGYGAVDLDARKVHKAVNEYDERLIFDRNLKTGEWTVWLLMEHGQAPYPLLSFGREVPDPELVLKQLYMSDSLRHGEEILRRMNANNDALERDKKSRWDDIVGEVAEIAESYLHRTGKTPYKRSLPKRDPKHKG